MNEKKWLTCADPAPMVHFLTGDEPVRAVVGDETASLYGYGRRISGSYTRTRIRPRCSNRKFRLFAYGCITCNLIGQYEQEPSRDGWEKWAETDEHTAQEFTCLDGAMYMAGLKVGQHHQVHLSWEEKKSRADLLRCIIGNPFNPFAFGCHICLTVVDAEIEECPSCGTSLPNWQFMTANDGLIIKLVQAMYDDNAFDRLPILADALEEVGMTNAAIMEHCRGPGPHARGCCVVDFLLGKD